MTFSTWATKVFFIFLPLVVAFLISRLIYGWIKNAGVQSSSFSPTVASILTAPLLVLTYYLLATKDFIHGNIEIELSRLLAEITIVGPIAPILLLLLVIYLREGF